MPPLCSMKHYIVTLTARELLAAWLFVVRTRRRRNVPKYAIDVSEGRLGLCYNLIIISWHKCTTRYSLVRVMVSIVVILHCDDSENSQWLTKEENAPHSHNAILLTLAAFSTSFDADFFSILILPNTYPSNCFQNNLLKTFQFSDCFNSKAYRNCIKFTRK